ncbi:hypothetical protein Tco_0751589 [Tanacetum coccineum]|uniref:Uncharacterized protein n=1 Tax=Tanacetum coccineum TaxID=301880 RepID=A0ABQ4Z4G2_9ASTR
MPGPKHPPSPDYVPSPEEPNEPEDCHPTTLSPGYVADFDPEEDPEEDPAEYPADKGDDDDEEDEEEDEEKEEHLASADSTALHTVDPVSSAEDIEAFETDESTPTPPRSPRLRKAGISVRLPPPMAASMEARITEYAAAPTPPSPPPSPPTPLSSPLPQTPSPPLLLPSPPTHTSPTYDEAPLGYRAARIQLRVASPPTHHPSAIPSLPMLLTSNTQKRARFTAPTGRFEVRESSSAAAARQAGHTLAHKVDYGFVDTVDASIHAFKSR